MAMQVGAYAVTPETLVNMLAQVTDAWKVRLRGVPPVSGDNPSEIAKAVLRANAKKVVSAGQGHFKYMWPSDFGKAFRGAKHALVPAYLRGVIAFMIRESCRLGRVTSCFSPRRGFDIPYYRGDNLPWLIHSVEEYTRWTEDKSLLEEDREPLRKLLSDYERSLFDGGLLSPSMTGDWMDTILRPSSTYNNLCALHMLRLAGRMGLEPRNDPAALEKRILEDRWRGDHFTDYAGTEKVGVDAGVLALYLGLFEDRLREAMIKFFELSELVRPLPIKVSALDYDPRLLPFLARWTTPKYHSSIWLHMGLMYLNGLKRAGRDVSGPKSKLEALFMRHRNIIEVVDGQGGLYQTFCHASEYGLSMAAGQYLELNLT